MPEFTHTLIQLHQPVHRRDGVGSKTQVKKLKRVDAVAGELKGLDDYDVRLDGQGPPSLPAFVFDF